MHSTAWEGDEALQSLFLFNTCSHIDYIPACLQLLDYLALIILFLHLDAILNHFTWKTHSGVNPSATCLVKPAQMHFRYGYLYLWHTLRLTKLSLVHLNIVFKKRRQMSQSPPHQISIFLFLVPTPHPSNICFSINIPWINIGRCLYFLY